MVNSQPDQVPITGFRLAPLLNKTAAYPPTYPLVQLQWDGNIRLS